MTNTKIIKLDGNLYNDLFGFDQCKDVILQTLGVTEAQIPRFRDAYYTLDDNEDPVICILTRTGGGNREEYEAESSGNGPLNHDIRRINGYRFDLDDEYDETYALFYFDVPSEQRHYVEAYLEINGKARALKEKFDKVIENIDAYPNPYKDIFDQLMEDI